MSIHSKSAQPRESWGSKAGFIAACMGAAIGLGNIWLFPWRLGAYGGAAFLVPYLLFAFGLVRLGLAAELAFGRRQQAGPVGAFVKLFKPEHSWIGRVLGAVPVIAPACLLIFYMVVVGWLLKYFWIYVTTGMAGVDTAQVFDEFACHPCSIPWHLLAMALVMGIIVKGVQKGLERLNKVAMPVLFAILLVLLVRTLTLPGAMDGVWFLIKPEWSYLCDSQTWIMALGQSFFSVGLGGMLTYGSYLKADMDIPNAATITTIMNCSASFLAAFVIMPGVFAFGLDPASGPDLLFVTAPKIFNAMPFGRFFASLFFLSVVFAGISSAISLFEIPVESLMDQVGLNRTWATLLVGLAITLPGLYLDVNMDAFVTAVDIGSVYMFPLASLIIALGFLWILGPQKALEAINQGRKKCWGMWRVRYLAWVFVPMCALVLILGIVHDGI